MTTERKIAAAAALAIAAAAAAALCRAPAPPAAAPGPAPAGPAAAAAGPAGPAADEFWAALADPLVRVDGEAIGRAEVQLALPADVSTTLAEREPRLRAVAQAAARLVDARLALAQLAAADRAALQSRVDLERDAELRRYGNAQAWAEDLARRLQTPQAWLTLAQTRAALDIALLSAGADQPPSEAELRQRYERRPARWQRPAQVHWREIAVQVEAGEAAAGERARQLLELAQQRLAKGEAFAALADELQRGRARQPGGDRGWNRLDELDPALARALEGLQPGERSGVVVSGHAMHLVELIERRPPGLQPFDEVRERLQAELLGERRFVQRRRMLEGLRAKAQISWGDPRLAELAAARPARPPAEEAPAATAEPPPAAPR